MTLVDARVDDVARPGVQALSKRDTTSTRRMLVLTLVDQGASSASNFGMALVVAHYSGARAVGIFALLMSTCVLAQGVVRGLTSDCLLTRSEVDMGLIDVYERSGYLASLTVSCVIALGLLAVSGLLSQSFVVPFVILAVTFPFMAVQDYARFIGISRHDPAYAIRLDVAWLVLFVITFIPLREHHLVSLAWIFGAWAASGAVVGIWTMGRHLSSDWRHRLAFWTRNERSVGLRFAGQFVVASFANYVIFYVLVLFVISVADVGRIKLAMLALGPVTVAAAGLQAALIPVANRRLRRDVRQALGFLVLAGAAVGVVTSLWAAFVYSLPAHVMGNAFGPAWASARPLLPVAGLAFVLAGFAGVANSGLRALRAAKQNLRVAVAMLPVTFVLFVVLCRQWGALGGVAAAAASAGCLALATWAVLLHLCRHLDPAALTEADGAASADITGPAPEPRPSPEPAPVPVTPSHVHVRLEEGVQ
jgi:O-antigen/teichoic acid export membrane protein